jgi:hypothetical protein
MALPAARYVSSLYRSAHSEAATWYSRTAGAQAVQIVRTQPEASPNIPGVGPVNQASVIIRMQTASSTAAGANPAKGDTFTVSGKTYTVFGAPRHADAHQLEWMIEAT